MEIYTIKEDTKRAIIGLLNSIIQVEYDMIMNYPRLIDKLVNIDLINDEQLNKDLEYLSKVSLQHFSNLNKIIELLDGELVWAMCTIERLVDVGESLDEQLKKEKLVISKYKETIQVVEKNKVKVKQGFLSKLLSEKVEAVDANYIVSTLKRHIMDEERHVRLVEDSIATFKALKNK